MEVYRSITKILTIAKVYRHLLFNRLGRSDDKLDPSVLRLGTLLLLFDVYLTWARVENSLSAVPKAPSAARLTNAPILSQYIFFLALNTLATLAHHVTVRLLVPIFLSKATSHTPVESPEIGASSTAGKPSGQERDYSTKSTLGTYSNRTAGPGLASPSAVSTALLVSSCTKLFPILLIIWPESTAGDSNDTGLTQSFASRARSYVGWAVLLNNAEALLILLNCGYVRAGGLALAGVAARSSLEGAFLAVAGLESDGGPVGDILWVAKKAMGMLPSVKS